MSILQVREALESGDWSKPWEMLEAMGVFPDEIEAMRGGGIEGGRAICRLAYGAWQRGQDQQKPKPRNKK